MAFEISNRIWIQNATHTHTHMQIKREIESKLDKTRTLLFGVFHISKWVTEEDRKRRRGSAEHEAELCSTETENHVLTSNNNNKKNINNKNINNNKNHNALISYNQKWHLKFCCCFWQSFLAVTTMTQFFSPLYLCLSPSLHLSFLSLPGWITANWFMLLLIESLSWRLKTQQIIQISLLIFPFSFPGSSGRHLTLFAIYGQKIVQVWNVATFNNNNNKSCAL